MANETVRYLIGSLGGLTLLAGSVGGLLALDTGPEPAAASLAERSTLMCSHLGTITSCAEFAAPAAVQAGPYKDGTYRADGHYATPGGAETIGVVLTLTSGEVSAVSLEVHATSPTARQFQVQFSSLFGDQVVGREISGLALSRVAGASLTSVGFNDAIAQIVEDAHV